MKTNLSTLWVMVMFNMVFADILSFMKPGFLAAVSTGYAGEVRITSEILLAFAMLLEIPIAMVFLSRALGYRANRWANVISSVITAAFVIAGGSGDLHYIFFETVEVVCMALIVWYAWKLPKTEGEAPAIEG